MDSGAVPLKTYTPTLNGSLWRTVWEGKDVREGAVYFSKKNSPHQDLSCNDLRQSLRDNRVLMQLSEVAGDDMESEDKKML